MPERREIGCIIMASGLSERYGKNKLLEKLEGREIILHTAGSLLAAGLRPLAVIRSEAVREALERESIPCVLHSGPRKSDTMHAGLEYLGPGAAGYLFIPGDQPLVQPASVRNMVARFYGNPERAIRLAWGDTAGSPVLFPAFCREKLLAYTGDRGGIEVLKNERIPCDPVQAGAAWELWDADTPEKMKQIREAYAGIDTADGRTVPGRGITAG